MRGKTPSFDLGVSWSLDAANTTVVVAVTALFLSFPGLFFFILGQQSIDKLRSSKDFSTQAGLDGDFPIWE